MSSSFARVSELVVSIIAKSVNFVPSGRDIEMKTREEMIWEIVLVLLPQWKGTTKDLFELANNLFYNYTLYISGELK